VPHVPIDVRELGCDFLVFSGHKLYGPMGIGVLYAKKSLLEIMPPFLFGGDMVKQVTLSYSTFEDAPHKFEAGTPNVAGAVGLAAAIRCIRRIGFAEIMRYENGIMEYCLKRLCSVSGLHILGSGSKRHAVVSFFIEGIPAHDVAAVLDEQGVAVRAGTHCAMPLHSVYCVDTSVRLSIAVYTTKEDIDALVSAIEHCKRVFA
jgi:cysteine desulfurase/selenocysteine lyase